MKHWGRDTPEGLWLWTTHARVETLKTSGRKAWRSREAAEINPPSQREVERSRETNDPNILCHLSPPWMYLDGLGRRDWEWGWRGVWLKLSLGKEEERYLLKCLILLFFSQYQISNKKFVLNASKLNQIKIPWVETFLPTVEWWQS